ncbi:flagellar biosynthesis protein FliQ [Litoribrevibacter albus]|uniref:Flagellar biosynthetic protein FliQ n=1 Tax=Litoribrevibacter albus TaxID=1473156 RepID=A0AA37SBR7_9GAMM|nr:flagellar biosynthesis protein FliQ [Litoribrevibacter albus]GLQ32349.1 flagellar export apparatus protein FliQ [Litoribrevibacter albus]
MTPEVVIDIFSDAIYLVMIMVAIIITPSLVVGLIVSTFQAATQINEQTLTFLPRLIITLFTLIVAGPWLMRELIDYTQRLITSIPLVIG